jgi:putative phosphoribosyl transferase
MSPRSATVPGADTLTRAVSIAAEGVELPGDCTVPRAAQGLVLFAHGSGSSRHSPRNRHVAAKFQTAGLGTLLFDLLPEEAEPGGARTELRFDIPLLTRRLLAASHFAAGLATERSLRLGYFGSSTGAAAALRAAAEDADGVAAVVSRGGRPDLAGDALGDVRAPTLLIVGGDDETVLELNQRALEKLHCDKRLAIVPGATHLFEEPGCLDAVADLAIAWFRKHLVPRGGWRHR